jgi:LytS/YehU family sensor histidine kinase
VGGRIPTFSDVYRVGLVVAVVLVALSLAFHRVELRAEQARQQALRSQLEALQARTNPHFLFNSLNTVAGLIEEDTKAAERVLEKLSHLFRYALDGSRTPWVRLEQEIEAVQSYLDVETIRLGTRLQSSVEVAPELREVQVPPLILQPLVENAVLHAIAPRKGGGRLRVEAARRGEYMELSVTDDGAGLGSSSHNGSRSSLENLRQRLGLVYDGRAQVDVTSEPGTGVRVTLRLPLPVPT